MDRAALRAGAREGRMGSGRGRARRGTPPPGGAPAARRRRRRGAGRAGGGATTTRRLPGGPGQSGAEPGRAGRRARRAGRELRAVRSLSRGGSGCPHAPGATPLSPEPRILPGPRLRAAHARRAADPRDSHAGRCIPAHAAVRHPRRSGGRVGVPATPLDRAAQAHSPTHVGASGRRHARTADAAPRSRGASVLPRPSVARGVARGAPGPRAIPVERGAAPSHRSSRETRARSLSLMIRSAAIAAAVPPAPPAAPAGATPPPVPAAVRRALTAATVLVLPTECGGVLAASPDVVATALHCIDRGAALRVRTSGGAGLRAPLQATDPPARHGRLVPARPAGPG